jgi:hypothetical protein
MIVIFAMAAVLQVCVAAVEGLRGRPAEMRASPPVATMLL